MYQNEINLIKPFGEIVREALKATDASLRTKMELETSYIDVKFFVESLAAIK